MATGTRRDYYEILGVRRDASLEDVKKAYRRLAVQYHPDRNPNNPESEERFKEASEAYAILSDAEKRSRYDRFGHQAVAGDGFSGFDPGAFGDFADILGDLFGFSFGDIFGARPQRARYGPRRGRDLQYTVSLTLEEAARGVDQQIKVPRLQDCDRCQGSGSEPGSTRETCSTCRGNGQVMFRRGFLSVSQTCPGCGGAGTLNRNPCTECSGRGRVENETKLKVTVPAGVDTGMRLRLVGEGERGVLGGPPGDLYVMLSVADHSRFERDGADLHAELQVTVFEAMLGAELEMPTMLDEVTSVHIKPGTQPGEVLRLRGLGMPQLNSGRRGDLYAHVRVIVPKRLTAEQRRLVTEAAKLDERDEGGLSGRLFERLKRALGTDA
jgi:molecular chaperone DnaJ